jgi:hypothetical protein
VQTGTGNSMRFVRNDDPRLVATKLLGGEPRDGMSIMFTRTGTGGTSLFLQLVDVDSVLAYMKMGTLLSIVGPDGETRGDVPSALMAQLPTTDELTEVTLDSKEYLVRAKDILGPDGISVGHVVMASRVDGVLSLFPGARTVFALAMIAATLVAVGMFTVARSRRG